MVARALRAVRARAVSGALRMQLPKIVLLIFVSGKIVLTGGSAGGHIPGIREHLPGAHGFRKLPNPGEEDPLAQLAAAQRNAEKAKALPAP